MACGRLYIVSAKAPPTRVDFIVTSMSFDFLASRRSSTVSKSPRSGIGIANSIVCDHRIKSQPIRESPSESESTGVGITRYLNVPPAQRGWRTTRRLADRPRGTALRLGRSVSHAGRSVEASCNRSRSYSLRLVLADFRCAAPLPTTPRSLNDTTLPGARLLALIRRRPVPVNT
jgi:hypothetical protein